MEDNPLLMKAFNFSLAIIKIYKVMQNEKHEYVMSKQLLRCSTSIGANLNEGIAAQSKKDFISKFSIALKEAYEARYWLKLIYHSNYADQVNDKLELLEEIIAMTASSIIKAKKNLDQTSEQKKNKEKND